MTNEVVMDKLAKLFNLSKSDNENEAAIAAARAAELMAKYQLASFDVQAYLEHREVVPEPEEGRIDDEEGAAYGKRCEAWESSLAETLARALGGRTLKYGSKVFKIVMLGPPGTVGAARYLFMALRREIDRLARKRTRELQESNAWRRAYAMGMVSRVSTKLREGREAGLASASSTALIHVEKMSAKVERVFADRGARTSKAGSSFKRPSASVEGYRDGASLDVGGVGRARIGAPKKQIT